MNFKKHEDDDEFQALIARTFVRLQMLGDNLAIRDGTHVNKQHEWTHTWEL